jgi:hypothetical protein
MQSFMTGQHLPLHKLLIVSMTAQVPSSGTRCHIANHAPPGGAKEHKACTFLSCLSNLGGSRARPLLRYQRTAGGELHFSHCCVMC